MSIEEYAIEGIEYLSCTIEGRPYKPVFPNKTKINMKIPIIGGFIIIGAGGIIVYILCFIITGHYGNAPEHIDYVTGTIIKGGLLQ